MLPVFLVEAMLDADIARLHRRHMQPAMTADHAKARQHLVCGGKEFGRCDGCAFGIKSGPAGDDLPAMAQPGLDLGHVIANLEAHLAEIGRQNALAVQPSGGQRRGVERFLIEEEILDDGAVKLLRRRTHAF